MEIIPNIEVKLRDEFETLDEIIALINKYKYEKVRNLSSTKSKIDMLEKIQEFIYNDVEAQEIMEDMKAHEHARL